jgi:nucleoside-diphosphate-sugar epimerase
MKSAILTGANGFIGAHVLWNLLDRGWHVLVLGRASASSGWAGRVSAALAEVGSTSGLPGRVFHHEVELDSPEPNLDALYRQVPRSAEATLFHIAGDTRFRPSNPELQRRMNVDAAVRLTAALKGRIARVVHVSTAYVSGKRSDLVLEADLDRGQEFWNTYEKSKFDAEVEVTALCRKEGIPLVIVRPSIIVNHRVSGRASTFTHLNAMVEVVNRIQDSYGLSDGQTVSRTIRLLADPAARPNLAPVDSIVPPLLQIAESPSAPGKTFHLCHPQPQSNLEIIRLIREAFKVTAPLGIEYVQALPRPMSRTEEMISRSLKVYAPYLNNRCEFDLGNSRAVVPGYDSHFTPLDVPYLRKVIDFQRQHRRQPPPRVSEV